MPKFTRTRAEIEEERQRRTAEAEEAARRAKQYAVEPVNLEITPENILDYLSRVAFFDPRNIYHPGGKLKELWELDRTTAMALLSVDVGADGMVRYRFPNRAQTLHLLMEFKRMLAGDGMNLKALDELLVEYRKRYTALQEQNTEEDKDA